MYLMRQRVVHATERAAHWQEIIATASDDETIGIWDLATAERVGTLEAAPPAIPILMPAPCPSALGRNAATRVVRSAA